MAQDLRIEITGDSGDLSRALAAAGLELSLFARKAKASNESVAQDTERTEQRIKKSWLRATRDFADFERGTTQLANLIATKRGGPINSLTRGIGNVIEYTGKFSAALSNMFAKLAPVEGDVSKLGSAFNALGLSANAVIPIFATLIVSFTTIGSLLIVLPAVIGAVVAAFVALLDTVAVLGAGLLAFAAPLTVVTALLGGLGAAFAYVTAQSIKNKATQQDVHDNLLKLHVAQQTYTEDVAKYGKTATTTENALLALHKAQDTYEQSQIGLALHTANIQDKFHQLAQTLSHDFQPQILFLIKSASGALSYLDRIAKLPLAGAFKAFSTSGIKDFSHFLQQVGYQLAKPFRLAIKFGFGVGGDNLSNQVKSLYNQLTNYLTGPRGALNPVVAWFHRQDFTETGLRWATEIIDGIKNAFAHDTAFGNSVRAILKNALSAGTSAFIQVLKYEIDKIWHVILDTTAGKIAGSVLLLITLFGPLVSLGRNVATAWRAAGAVMDYFAVSALAAADADAAAAAEFAASATTEVAASKAAAVAAADFTAATVAVDDALLACEAAAASAATEIDVLAVAAADAAKEGGMLWDALTPVDDAILACEAAAAGAATQIDVLAAAAAAATPEVDALAAAAAAAAAGETELAATPVEAALTACAAAATAAAGAEDGLALSASAAAASQTELFTATDALSGSIGGEYVAGLIAATGATADLGTAGATAAGEGGLGAIGLTADGLLGPIAAVGAALTAVFLIAKGGSIGPFGKTNVTGFAPSELAQMKKDGVTQQQVLHAVAQGAITAADDIDRARTASDRLYGALNHLNQVKLSLKTDKINLQLDQLAVKEDKANLANLLKPGSGASNLEITGARLQLKQAKIQVQTDKSITIPYDKQQIAGAVAYIGKQTKKIQDSLRNVFKTQQGAVFKDAPFESKQKAIQDALNLTHGKLINAARGFVDYANRVRATNPQLAEFKDKTAAQALAVDELTQKIGHTPSQKRINIYFQNNLARLIQEANDLAGAINAIPIEHNTVIRTYHVNSGPSTPPREAGGPVNAGVPYMVGERGREVFIPEKSGSMMSNADVEKVARAVGAREMSTKQLPAAEPTAHINKTLLDKKIHARINEMWDYIGHRFFPGYNKPHVKLVDNLHYQASAVTLPGPIPRDIVSRRDAMGPLAGNIWPYRAPIWKNISASIMIHEMAHAYQRPGVFGTRWTAEGGAEAFTYRVITQVLNHLNIRDTGNHPSESSYPLWTQEVRKRKTPEWQLFGQFAHLSPVDPALEAAYVKKYRFHQYGGNFWPGEISMVGENGPELRVENTAGRYVPTQATQRMLSAGETHLHFHFPNAVIVDKKTVEHAARLVKPSLDKMQSRRG